MRQSGNSHFKFFFICFFFQIFFLLYFHWSRETWKSQCWIRCNWQQNGIVCIAVFGCLHKSPPKLKFHNKPKWSHSKRTSLQEKSRNKTKWQIKSNKDSLREQSIVDPFMQDPWWLRRTVKAVPIIIGQCIYYQQQMGNCPSDMSERAKKRIVAEKIQSIISLIIAWHVWILTQLWIVWNENRRDISLFQHLTSTISCFFFLCFDYLQWSHCRQRTQTKYLFIQVKYLYSPLCWEW